MRTDKIKIDLLIHDLKVPLAVIKAGINFLLNRREKYGPLTQNQERVMARVLRNAKIAQALVNDALELERSAEGVVCFASLKVSSLIEQTLVEVFDLADGRASERITLCQDLSGLRQALQGQGIFLIVDEGLWCQDVCVDVPKLRQILRNLLNNAMKYRKRRVELGVDEANGFLILSVKDDGEGIPSDYHEKIFESYFQMDSDTTSCVRGHGLGLAGVMVLVEDMGGRLILESGAGQGAKFLVEIPLKDSM